MLAAGTAIAPFSRAARCSPRGRIAMSSPVCAAPSPPRKVFLTGAGGRTGGLVLQQLLKDKASFDVKGLVRSKDSAKKRVPEAGDDVFLVGDVLKDADLLRRELEGVDTLIILTSAVSRGTVLSVAVQIIFLV